MCIMLREMRTSTHTSSIHTISVKPNPKKRLQEFLFRGGVWWNKDNISFTQINQIMTCNCLFRKAYLKKQNPCEEGFQTRGLDMDQVKNLSHYYLIKLWVIATDIIFLLLWILFIIILVWIFLLLWKNDISDVSFGLRVN